ncbi:50S ribosome-binding GTPase, partial [Escherichia coli]|nr:50S ribosome-binding GTPase [Escherichia coli]
MEDLTEFEDADIAPDEYTEEEAEAEFQRLQEQPIKLAIIGRPNVGKSTLTNRILGEERVVVYDMPGTTRDSIYI